jgi:hypothetical protein
MRNHRWSWLAVGLTAALVLSACGDDDDVDEGASDDVAAYCEAVAVVDATDDVTVEQIEAVRDAAPEEISEAVDVVADAFVEGIEADDIESVFSDPEVNQALEDTIEPFEEENCPEDEGDEGAVNPEFEEYCALAEDFNEAEEFVDEEIQALIDAAPEEIADEVTLAGNALIEQGEAAFNDPEVVEAADAIQEFETEECGIDSGSATGDLTSDAPADAAVAVSAIDYGFEFTAPLAGVSTFEMTNNGAEPHFMYIVQLAEGVTFEEAFAAEGEDGTVTAEAGSDTAAPGETAELTVDLPAGEYAMVCFIETADGTPHAELGMAVPFTVS